MKNKKLKILSGLGALLMSSSVFCGCYRNDTQVTEINVPALSNPDCAEFLLKKLVASRRNTNPIFIIDAEVDPQRQIARVTYNARVMSLRNLEHTIADLGFEVHSSRPTEAWDPYIIPAKAEARAKLPEGCR